MSCFLSSKHARWSHPATTMSVCWYPHSANSSRSLQIVLTACWLLHDFVNSRACFSETGRCRNCLSILWFLPLQLTLFSSSQPSKVNKGELFMVGDSINKDDNDVTAGDIITVCQPGQQKRALLRLPSCLGNSSSWEKGVPKHWCIHLAFSLILPLYSHIQIFLRKLL